MEEFIKLLIISEVQMVKFEGQVGPRAEAAISFEQVEAGLGDAEGQFVAEGW